MSPGTALPPAHPLRELIPPDTDADAVETAAWTPPPTPVGTPPPPRETSEADDAITEEDGEAWSDAISDDGEPWLEEDDDGEEMSEASLGVCESNMGRSHDKRST